MNILRHIHLKWTMMMRTKWLGQMQCNTGAATASGSTDIDSQRFELTLKASGATNMRKGVLAKGGKRIGVCSFARISTQILPKAL